MRTFADLNRQWLIQKLLVEFLLGALTQQHRFACTNITRYSLLVFPSHLPKVVNQQLTIKIPHCMKIMRITCG